MPAPGFGDGRESKASVADALLEDTGFMPAPGARSSAPRLLHASLGLDGQLECLRRCRAATACRDRHQVLGDDLSVRCGDQHEVTS